MLDWLDGPEADGATRGLARRVRVLDIGAGTGLLSFMALRAGAGRAIAVELNAAMVGAARAACVANGVAVRVVPARPVVARTRLEREGSVAVVPPTTRLSRASQRRLNHLGLHVDQHRPGDRRHVGRGRAADVGVVLVPVRLAEESSADARAVARGGSRARAHVRAHVRSSANPGF